MDTLCHCSDREICSFGIDWSFCVMASSSLKDSYITNSVHSLMIRELGNIFFISNGDQCVINDLSIISILKFSKVDKYFSMNISSKE